MAPKSRTFPLWDPYEIFDVFPNTKSFPCLDPRCRRFVDRKDTQAACARLGKMALKDPSGIGEKSLARLAVLCFCSKHREDPMHEHQILAKVFEWLSRIEDVLEERGKETKRKIEDKELKRKLKKAKRKAEREVTRLLDEVNGLKEQLRRTVDENGMLEQQIAADEQRSTEKQMTMSRKIVQLQRQVSEGEGAKDDAELANTVYAREKERLERELERIKKIAVCSREVRIKEVNELKAQLQDSGARVEEAARHIGDLKNRLEESNARLENMEQETSEEIRELKCQLDSEREMTMELNELTNQLKESNTCLEESKSHHEVIERQTTAEINELRDQLDKSNTSLGDLRQGSITEASELKDQLTRCKDIIAELKAAGSANIVQLECEVDRCEHIPEDCQTRIACDIAGSRQFIESDDAVEQLKAARSHEKDQLSEEVHGLKERLRNGKAASTMPTSVLQTEVQSLRMWRHFPICRSYVHLLFKQGKVEQVETTNSALSDEVLRLREQARDVDRRLASQVVGLSLVICRCFKVADKYQEKISVLKPRNVKQGVKSVCRSFLVVLSVFEGC